MLESAQRALTAEGKEMRFVDLWAKVKADLAKKHAKFYTVDGVKIARELGLRNRFSMVLQAAFFKLANIIPIDEAVGYMKEAVVKSFGKKGEDTMVFKGIFTGFAYILAEFFLLCPRFFYSVVNCFAGKFWELRKHFFAKTFLQTRLIVNWKERIHVQN